MPIWESRDGFGATKMLVNDAKLGASLAATLGDKPVALMRGHGDVVVGPNVRVATLRAVCTGRERQDAGHRACRWAGRSTTSRPPKASLRDKDPSDPTRTWEPVEGQRAEEGALSAQLARPAHRFSIGASPI